MQPRPRQSSTWLLGPTFLSPLSRMASMSSSVISLSLEAKTCVAPWRMIDNISSLPSLLAVGSTSLPVGRRTGVFYSNLWPPSLSLLRCFTAVLCSAGSEGAGGRTLLNDDGVQAQLHLGPLHDPLLHCVLRDEAENSHLLLLTNPVGSVLR